MYVETNGFTLKFKIIFKHYINTRTVLNEITDSKDVHINIQEFF